MGRLCREETGLCAGLRRAISDAHRTARLPERNLVAVAQRREHVRSELLRDVHERAVDAFQVFQYDRAAPAQYERMAPRDELILVEWGEVDVRPHVVGHRRAADEANVLVEDDGDVAVDIPFAVNEQ